MEKNNVEITKMSNDDLIDLKDSLISEFDDFWTFNILKQEFDNENTTYIVAKDNDTVLLKVDLSDGYSLLGAYNGDGEKVALLTDSNGNYYVIVPRGGGVYLSVSLSAPTVKSASYDFSGASRAVVTFDLDGGILDGAVDGVYTVNTWTGNYIHLPEEPEKEGYEFDGWTLDENVYRAGQSFTVKADSITFKALWKETTAA